MKNKKMNLWVWKWHVIAGLISSPFIILLAITGAIYLFKDTYEKPRQQHIINVIKEGNRFSYEAQRKVADSILGKPHNAMVLPLNELQATQFVSGKFSHKKSIYINPYTNKPTGKIDANDGIMYKVRKLHGELLLSTPGTLIVELIASWMLVLLITGIFIWWPARGWRVQGFFVPRINKGKALLFRDLHAISAFWISLLLILVLAGAFPWTNVVGENFKTLQKITNTGFPKSWMGLGVDEPQFGKQISLDDIVLKAEALNLKEEVTIEFPKGPSGVYSVGNTNYKSLNSQQKYHYSKVTGKLIKKQNWNEVGVLMRARMWVMAFHQGQFGKWNWYLMLTVAIILLFSSIMAIWSYFSKKPKGSWNLPNVPESFNVSKLVMLLIFCLALLFPLFGISVILILIFQYAKKKF